MGARQVYRTAARIWGQETMYGERRSGNRSPMQRRHGIQSQTGRIEPGQGYQVRWTVSGDFLLSLRGSASRYTLPLEDEALAAISIVVAIDEAGERVSFA